MKRFLFVVAFCTSLLAGLALFLFPVSYAAAENPLVTLLNLPAPPPPNPDVTLPPTDFPPNFFSTSNPPPDEASIEYLMAYWRAQSARGSSQIRHKIYPSDKVLARLIAELEKQPRETLEFLNIFPPTERAADFVKKIYEQFASGDETERQLRGTLKRWLKFNTQEFSTELAREAERVSDANDYVTHHNELIALARVDWNRAGPIVSRLYNNPGQRASRTAALWALYLHAIEVGSPSDTDRYRDELKQVVADKSLPAGIRDLALDALSLEKEWSGQEDWYISLLEDETLFELGNYTGLTTIITASPDEKYIDRMIALLDSDNINVRTAAARNLILKLNTERPEILKALLPWLRDPKWLKPSVSGRESVVQALAQVKVPEAVPFLIAALDEKGSVRRYSDFGISNANRAVANAMAAAANAAQAAANAVSDDGDFIITNMNANAMGYSYPGSEYPLRYSAIGALSFQQDIRAVPALRRLLNEADELHEQNSLVGAIYNCGGFSIPEQVDAVEEVAKNLEVLETSPNSNMAANVVYGMNRVYPISNKPGGGVLDVRRMLGAYLSQQTVVREDVARAVVDRITALDRSDSKTADAMRKIVMRWHAPAVYTLLLRDLKHGRPNSDGIVRLLTVRGLLREQQQSDVFDIRTGSPIAVGISACLIEQPNDFDSILDGPSDEAKTAMLACARLIRAPLPVQKVAELLQSKDKLLAIAAERYLETEDSPEARRIVLSFHPNEAKILGSTMAFYPGSDNQIISEPTRRLFATVNPYFALTTYYSEEFGRIDHGEIEARLQDELKKNADLLGVYNWQENYIHIFKDRAVLSWHDDPARYRERLLTKDEFDNFRGLISHYKADELQAFLVCADCPRRQLLMIGRNGGRRVYVKAETLPPFFAELDRVFADLRRAPAAIKYWAGKDIPGLEVLFADDRYDARTVWKNGTDFRLLTADKTRQPESDEELDEYAAPMDEDVETEEIEVESEYDPRVSNERLRRQYESFAWFNFSASGLGTATVQPPAVEYIPMIDDLEVSSTVGQWKARAGMIEIRADSRGLYKIAAGKLTRIKSGSYSGPVVTPNGRWVIVSKYDDESGIRLVRVNLLTSKEFTVEAADDVVSRAVAFVPSINRVLVGGFQYEYEHHYGRPPGDPDEQDGGGYHLLDPETGRLIRARGEVRPLAQQTFRALQSAANPFEFWAAIPKGDETVVGIYNTRIFTLKPVLKLPRIRFDSMDMWAAADEGKVYFVYEGHLLAAPINPSR